MHLTVMDSHGLVVVYVGLKADKQDVNVVL